MKASGVEVVGLGLALGFAAGRLCATLARGFRDQTVGGGLLMRAIVAIASSIGVAFMVAPPAVASDVAKSWEKAVVYVAGGPVPGGVAGIKTAKPAGALLFMHGCSGIGTPQQDAHRWAALVSKQGYIVVMPDSMARADRKPSCDPVAKKAGLFPPVHGMRLEEINYAAGQIRKQAWFDGKTLFLMGYSEGAVAAVRSKLAGLRGVIATSWTCTNSLATDFDGVFTPPETPLLTLMHVEDPWFRVPFLKGSCANKIAGRKNARHVVVPGKGHGTYDSAAARNAVVAFLATQAAAP